jgi:hypothetical protein
MKIIKRLLLTLVVLTLVSAAGFYLYIQSLPTAPPDFVNAHEVNNDAAAPFQCNNNTALNNAYRVQVTIESVLNDELVYQSNLKFDTQLSQVNGAIIKGTANNIIINEGQGDVDIKDVYYLGRVDAQPFAVFTAFNDLGLTEKHPMKILSQLFKALSVGSEGKNYHYAYDSMQRTYRYQHNNNQVSRSASSTTANLNQLSSSLQTFQAKGHWQATLEKDCMPIALTSQERKGISAAGHQGYIKFSIEAKKIQSYIDLKNININPLSNANNHWQIKTIASSQFEQEVKDEAELWSILSSFENDKNSAKLIKAAEYLIDNISPDELANSLIEENIPDHAKRDLAFALSLSGHPDVENYLIDSLLSLSTAGVQGDMNQDLQKVRLMVALSGNGLVSEQGFQALASIADNQDENSNVRNNALINLGSTLEQLKNHGLDSASLQEQLSATVSDALSSDNSSSAILAAGNAKLDNLDTQIASKLNSSNSKERYAAASVLARNPEHYDELIQHLSLEQSDLVNYAILTNLDATQLTGQQKDDLRDMASNTSADISKVILQLIDK